MATLTVCIVTQNEELNIATTLDTITFADQIVIVDAFSTDSTVAICRKYTQEIYLNIWEGCGIQKQFALSKATKDWVLILDADERLSPKLQTEIQLILKNPGEFQGFLIPFQTFYLGQAIKYGDWYKEQHLRLFKRTNGKIIANYVHFGLEVAGKIGKLTNYVYHDSFPTVEKVLTKINNYSSLGAKDQLKAKKTATIWTAIFHGLFAFIRSYILRFGFLDGKYGFMLAVAIAEGSYYKYIKLLTMKNITKL